MSYNADTDLEAVISDAVNDSQLSEETPETDTSTDTPADPVEASTDAPAEEAAPESTSDEVASPAANQTPTEVKPPADDFEKIAGVPQMGIGGRENRIPYSRVKKITERAVNEVAEAVVGRKLNPGEKPLDVVKTRLAQFSELETKTKDYESRLDTVGRFEQMMETQPQEFLRRLSTLPAYSDFFQFVQKALDSQNGQASASTPVAASVPVGDEMPQPDEELADGTKVYSMEGLQALLSWRDKQVETRVTKQIEDRYKPIESEWQERRRIEATLPIVQAKIKEARSWPLFNESEAEITAALERDPNLSLDAAYRFVVFPKLVSERNKMRDEVLTEVSRAPKATNLTPQPVKPTPPSNANRSIEDIIAGEVAKIRRA